MEYDNKATSAGLLMYKKAKDGLEIFLVHPGGPYFKGKEKGYWGIPKGVVEEGEDTFEGAIREFEEETGIIVDRKNNFIDLGFVIKKSGKKIYAWAFEGDWSGKFTSNNCETEWPPKSGKIITIPENDDGGFFNIDKTKELINERQWEFIKRLIEELKE